MNTRKRGEKKPTGGNPFKIAALGSFDSFVLFVYTRAFRTLYILYVYKIIVDIDGGGGGGGDGFKLRDPGGSE